MLLKGKQILIVEDNVQNRVIFQVILTKYGAQVDFERWGEGAILLLKRLTHVDAIILDLMLAHNVNGYDVYDQIRAIPEFNHIPIVAVSATDPGFAIPKAQQQGFSGFISKPIDHRLFPQQLSSIMNGEKVWYAGKRVLKNAVRTDEYPESS